MESGKDSLNGKLSSGKNDTQSDIPTTKNYYPSSLLLLYLNLGSKINKMKKNTGRLHKKGIQRKLVDSLKKAADLSAQCHQRTRAMSKETQARKKRA